MNLRRMALSALLPTLLPTAIASATTIQLKGSISNRQPGDNAYNEGLLVMTFTVDGSSLPLPTPHSDDDYFQLLFNNVQATITFTTPPLDPPATPIPVVTGHDGVGAISTSTLERNEVTFNAGEISGNFFVPLNYTGNGPIFGDNGFDTSIVELAPGPQSILPYTEYFDLDASETTILSADTPETSSLLLLGSGALASAFILFRRHPHPANTW